MSDIEREIYENAVFGPGKVGHDHEYDLQEDTESDDNLLSQDDIHSLLQGDFGLDDIEEDNKEREEERRYQVKKRIFDRLDSTRDIVDKYEKLAQVLNDIEPKEAFDLLSQHIISKIDEELG